LPDPVHVASVAPVVQAHVVLSQHTPVQGEGVHVPLQKNRLPEPVQVARVAPVVQAQVVLLQHTPVQGEGVHVPLQ
jgi:hypothetical protein